MVSHAYKCLTSPCRSTRDSGTAKISNEVEAAKHHQRFPEHEIAILETRVVAIFGQNTEPIIEVCVNCRNTLVGCNISGCGQRKWAGWRDATDVPPY